MTPSNTELANAEYTANSDNILSAERWWGHTGQRPGHGAVISVSNKSCIDSNCGAEPGDLDDEHVCEVITRPNTCDSTKYRFHFQTSHICPYEVDCGGVHGNYVRVRLPGQGRILSLANVDVFRTKPVGIPTETALDDSKRGYGCYGVEAHYAPDASSANFLEEVKVLDYTISLDPKDPIFYSTCLTYETTIEWLPIQDDSSSADTEVARQWNFSGWCLDCDSYYQNFVNKTSALEVTPQWWFSPICEDCDVKFGFKDPNPSPAPSYTPAPSPKPTTAAPTAAQRDHAVEWVIGKGTFDTLKARIGDTVSFTTDPNAHTVFIMASKAKYDACDFTGATQVTGDASPLVFEVPTLDSASEYYFACDVGEHCSLYDQKFKLAVTNFYASSAQPSAVPTVAPEPGVTVVVSEEEGALLVSEDGTSSTSSFTIALDTIPLSDVTITFSSADGGLECAPASVVFTHEDFGTAVTVVVRGMDDDIDQGESHADSVDFKVASLDSITKCTRAGRFDCSAGQSASYDGFSIESLDVTIVDDDEAGVIVALSTTSSESASSSLTGRYVRIFKQAESDRLNFAEVKVFGANGDELPIFAHTNGISGSNSPANAYDGDFDNYYLCWFTGEAWVQVRGKRSRC